MSVFCPAVAIAQARLMAVVVLPTPPFWFAIQKIRAMAFRVSGQSFDGRVAHVPHVDLLLPKLPRRWKCQFA